MYIVHMMHELYIVNVIHVMHEFGKKRVMHAVSGTTRRIMKTLITNEVASTYNFMDNGEKHPFSLLTLTLSLPVMRICVIYSTVYNDTLVAKGLKKIVTGW